MHPIPEERRGHTGTACQCRCGGGSRRVFKQFSWLEVGSVKVALPHPIHQRVTPTVRRLIKAVRNSCLIVHVHDLTDGLQSARTEKRDHCSLTLHHQA